MNIFMKLQHMIQMIWKRYIESVLSLMISINLIVSINLVNNIKHKYYGRY